MQHTVSKAMARGLPGSAEGQIRSHVDISTHTSDGLAGVVNDRFVVLARVRLDTETVEIPTS